MKKFKIFRWAKVCGVFFIFMMVAVMIGTFNSPSLDSLTGEVATRYIEMPSGKYAGDAVLNTITGQGSFYFDTGEMYEGSWKDNEMSGKGKFTYTTGVYEGQFADSKRNGQGSFTWEDGSTYVGNWISDKLNGEGTLTQGQTVYKGTFADNKLKEGSITFTTEIGSYKLSAVEGALTDQIEITYANGITYKGGFTNNTISGTGTMTYPNIGKYEGNFSDGKRSGQGTFTWNDGVSYVGAWSNDLMHGEGQYNISSTIYLKGSFDNGTLNGTYTYHNEKGNYKTTWVNNKNTKVEEE